MELALGIDIGGTFTDVVLAGEHGIATVVKLLTSSDEPARAAVDGASAALRRAGIEAGAVTRVVHGTTLATNAILERRDPAVAFVTTRGFRSLLHLGRHARVEEERFDLLFRPPPPVADLLRTFEVPERTGPTGEIEEPLDEAAVRELARTIAATDATAVAVCLLHAYANPAHERRVGELLREVLAVDVVLSSDVWPEVREFERATTTAMSAFVGPLMTRYLTDLARRLHGIGIDAPLSVMESAGGVMPVELACRRAVATIESGPAAGAIAARVVGTDLGRVDVIAFDMGGTTAKAAVIRGGRPDVTHQFQVGGRGSFGTRRSGTGVPIKTPTIDLAEVGAGGGSIAWIDDAGALHVGPRSAGSDPGPAWYGLGGTLPTVTDASIVLGLLDPAGFASAGAGPGVGRALRFDAAASRDAVEKSIARPLGVGIERAAAAIHEIANATMAGAIRVVTVQRGIDPRAFTLVASGGAGPLHATRIAERFDITTVIVPPACGVTSALGLLASDLRTELVQTLVSAGDDVDLDRLAGIFDELEAAATRDLGRDDRHAVHFDRSIDVRYPRQAHELNVPLTSGPITAGSIDTLRRAFFQQHRDAFGVGDPGPVELVSVRLRATLPVPHARFRRDADPAGHIAGATGARTRGVWNPGSGTFVATPVRALAGCPTDRPIEGPALLESPEATVLVPDAWSARVDPSQAVVLSSGGGSG